MAAQTLSGARADSLRSALDSVFASPAYQWESRPDPLGPIRRMWDALQGWFYRLGAENPFALRALVWLLVAILIGILLHAAWIAVQSVRAGSGHDLATTRGNATPPRGAGWYRAEADRLAGAGRYVEAVQADFLRLVLELDARRVTRFHPSRTPNEYVENAALSNERREELRDLVRSLYSYAFARAPLDRDAFDAWRVRASADRYAPAL